MSLENRRASLRRFFFKGVARASSDARWLEGLKSAAFKEKSLLPGEDHLGFCVYGDELSSHFSIENVAVGKYLTFSLRRDILRIPATLLRLHERRLSAERSAAGGAKVVSRRQLKEIREEVQRQLADQISPTIQIAQVLVDPVRREVLLGSTSTHMSQALVVFFEKHFSIRLLQANFMSMAERLVDKISFERVLDEPSGSILGKMGAETPDSEDGPEARLGAGFLTWLLFQIHGKKRPWTGEWQVMAENFVLLEGESEGSRQTLVRQGAASHCAELSRALQVGKLVSRMHCVVAREGEEGEWAFAVDKVWADLVGIKSPKANEPDFHARRLQRFAHLVQGFETLDHFFTAYLDDRYGESWSQVRRQMAKWVAEGAQA